uniref:Transposase n=1 Tax=Ascaris lumbricoides TaxID=6252 RepID=A0A0M3I7W5_ASCLU
MTVFTKLNASSGSESYREGKARTTYSRSNARVPKKNPRTKKQNKNSRERAISCWESPWLGYLPDREEIGTDQGNKDRRIAIDENYGQNAEWFIAARHNPVFVVQSGVFSLYVHLTSQKTHYLDHSFSAVMMKAWHHDC